MWECINVDSDILVFLVSYMYFPVYAIYLLSVLVRHEKCLLLYQMEFRPK